MIPEQLAVTRIQPDMVGIVTTLDGRPIESGDIAGGLIHDHDNFQNAQSFLAEGGRRGLQEQVLLSGAWNLNPWFVAVESVPMLNIPIGSVGVVISFVGLAHEDVSGAAFKHGDLVNVGHKGVWVTPLNPGKHPINTRIMRVELVPTTNIVLNWANRSEAHHYDEKLNSITVRSKDGFAFNLDVAQIIHVGALDAPKVISRLGSMQNLVDHALQPIVGNYFRNSAQHHSTFWTLTELARPQIWIDGAEAADMVLSFRSGRTSVSAVISHRRRFAESMDAPTSAQHIKKQAPQSEACLCSVIVGLTAEEQPQQNDHRNRHTQKPKQKSASHLGRLHLSHY
eukprot:gene38939-52583_t